MGTQYSWWRHQMKTFSWHFVRGNPPITGGFPSPRPVTRSFDVFVDLRLNKRLSKQPRRRRFETPPRSSRCHCNANELRWLAWMSGYYLISSRNDHQGDMPYLIFLALTHWSQDKMGAIYQSTLSNAFSSMKMFELWIKCQRNMFLRVQLAIRQRVSDVIYP